MMAERRDSIGPKIVGLTGSIGMGKSTTADLLRARGVAVFDADATVHRLQQKNGVAIPAIEAAFPGIVTGGVLDRAKLGALVFSDPSALKALEAIMHPLVGEARATFFRDAQGRGDQFVVLDVPLLFETGGDAGCDAVIVCSAPADVQRARVLDRPDMTDQKFDDILARQVPDSDKRARADFVVETDKGLDDADRQIGDIIKLLETRYER